MGKIAFSRVNISIEHTYVICQGKINIVAKVFKPIS